MSNWLGGKLAAEISFADIQDLVDSKAAEDQWLDFKSDMYEPTKRHEMLKDVVALANADGGYLLIGVEEDGRGAAVRVRGVARAQEEAENAVKSCVHNISPRIEGLEVRAVGAPGGAEVIVIRVPPSARRPHMYTLKGRTQFVRRYDTHSREMTIEEIREMFLGDQSLLALHRLSDGVEELLHRQAVPQPPEISPTDDALAVSSPAELARLMGLRFGEFAGQEPYYRIAALPAQLGPNQVDIGDGAIRQLFATPPRTRQDGWVIFPMHDIKVTGEGLQGTRLDRVYRLELLRNGYVEYSVMAHSDHFQWRQPPGEAERHPWLYTYAVCELPVNFVRLVAAIAERSGFQGEYSFSHSYTNIKGFRLMLVPPGRFPLEEALSPPFPHQELKCAPVSRHVPFDLDRVAFDLVEQVYGTFGYSRDRVPLFTADYRFDPNAGPMARG